MGYSLPSRCAVRAFAFYVCGVTMPTPAPHPCSVPGCPELSRTRGQRCPAHEAEADRRKGTTVERGYDTAWRRCRARYLYRNPWCERCERKAVEVDHIDGDPTGPNRLQFFNLRGLCGPCHRQRTNRDQPGGILRR